jgi:hypothetical protein
MDRARLRAGEKRPSSNGIRRGRRGFTSQLSLIVTSHPPLLDAKPTFPSPSDPFSRCSRATTSRRLDLPAIWQMKTKRHRRLHGLERDGAPSILNARYRNVSIDTDYRTQLTVDRGSTMMACICTCGEFGASRAARAFLNYIERRKKESRSIDRSFGDLSSR